MPARLSTELYIEKATKKWQDRFDYSRLIYVNCNTDVEIGCPEHGFIFINADSHIYSETGCRDCGYEQRKHKNTHPFDKVKKECEDIHKDDEGKPLYEYDESSYTAKSKPFSFYCKIHKEWFHKQTPLTHIRQESGCPKCGIIERSDACRFTKEEFIEKANQIFIPNNTDYYKLDLHNLTEDKKGIFICENNHEYEQVIYSHLSGMGCKECGIIAGAEKRKVTTDEFKQRSLEIHGKKYDYSKVDIDKDTTHVNIICNKHNKIFNQSYEAHLQGQGCPLCRESKGEIKANSILEKHSIRFIRQYKFDDCYSIGKTGRRTKLPFDFYLPDYNCCIEYNGQQHYDKTAWGGKSMDRIKRTDKIKKKYCKDNNISLITISYKINFNDIEEYLLNLLP
jgi:hypothetical protein